MITIKTLIITNDWIEVTWIETLEEVETIVHCESFSGHPEHIQMLRDKALEFKTDLTDYESEIAEAIKAFVMPSDDEIAKELLAHKIQEAQAYLNSTDWYYARKAETGEEVPEDVVANRVSARQFIKENK